MVPTREIFWNVGDLRTAVYLLALVSIMISVYGTVRHFRRWSLGKKEKRLDQLIKRLKYLGQFLFTQKPILRETFPGIMHLLIFWGIFILFLGTLTIAFQEDILHPFFGKKILLGQFYLFYSLILDLFGLLAIAGILLSIYRRYVIKPEKLDNRPSDLLLLSLILFVLITGFCVEGLRLGASQPPWALWEPGGWLLGRLFHSAGFGKTVQRDLHKMFWWVHLVAGMALVAYLPFSNLFHILSSSLNIFFRSFKPRGSLPLIDFSKGQPFGIEKIRDFTWKHLLDLDACTRCGRCQENCPAYLSKKPLNPKKVILDLRTSLDHLKNHELPLVDRSVSEDELWACTTCHACVEVCPVYIEHVEKIIGLRRQLIMENAQFPPEVKSLFKNLEIYGDTHGQGVSYRTDWFQGLSIKRVREGPTIDILYWAGCEGSFSERNRNVSKILLKIFQEAGLSVGTLGREERCCGDPARRIGNEYLFQELARANLDVFNRYGINKIVTYCPHCFHTLRNDYALLGPALKVWHYSEFLMELFRQGRLTIKRPFEAIVTFQDPCYLGRVNGIYDAPREILKRIPGVVLKEMDRSKEKSFCCGGGGGRMWMHEHLGQRINQIRAKEALGAGVDWVVTGCPYCLTMFEEGVKSLESEGIMRTQGLTLDLSEVLHRSIL